MKLLLYRPFQKSSISCSHRASVSTFYMLSLCSGIFSILIGKKFMQWSSMFYFIINDTVYSGISTLCFHSFRPLEKKQVCRTAKYLQCSIHTWRDGQRAGIWMRQADPCWMPHCAWVFGGVGTGAIRWYRSKIRANLGPGRRQKKKKKSISDNCEVLLLKISACKNSLVPDDSTGFLQSERQACWRVNPAQATTALLCMNMS